MELQLIIERLNATIEKLDELKPEQFSNGRFVSEFDTKEWKALKADTAGFYPIWFPDYGFKYVRNDAIWTIQKDGMNDITRALMQYHGLSTSLVHCLFYGKPIIKEFPIITSWKIEIKVTPLSSLGDVKKAFAQVRDLLQSQTIKPHIEY